MMIAVLGTGCNKQQNPDGREDVSGKITLNGQILKANANIRFVALSDDRAAGGGGQVNAGKYHLTGQDAIKPGKYKVRIEAYELYDRKTLAPATGETGDFDFYQVVLVPPEFNVESTLEFEVVAGKKNVFNYDIVTSYVPDTKPKGNAPAMN